MRGDSTAAPGQDWVEKNEYDTVIANRKERHRSLFVNWSAYALHSLEFPIEQAKA